MFYSFATAIMLLQVNQFLPTLPTKKVLKEFTSGFRNLAECGCITILKSSRKQQQDELTNTADQSNKLYNKVCQQQPSPFSLKKLLRRCSDASAAAVAGAAAATAVHAAADSVAVVVAAAAVAAAGAAAAAVAGTAVVVEVAVAVGVAAVSMESMGCIV